MKGYKPILKCKKEIEAAHNEKILELGMINKSCNCENGYCKKNHNK